MQRKVHKFDAKDQSVGRLATQIAIILRGKNKPEFMPHEDCGDVVEVKNIRELKFSGKKLEQKEYYRYSGYPGGLKTTRMGELMKTRPDEVLRRAVREMLPPVKFRSKMLKRLIINV